jgi:hypothetical protein
VPTLTLVVNAKELALAVAREKLSTLVNNVDDEFSIYGGQHDIKFICVNHFFQNALLLHLLSLAL